MLLAGAFAMDRLTPSDIRAASKLDFAEYEYPAPVPPVVDDPLQLQIDRAHAYVEYVTGQDFAAIDSSSVTGVLLGQCVQLRTEQQVVQAQQDYVGDINEDAIDFSVTGFSQKRIHPAHRRSRQMINSWPTLNDLLVGAMTEEKKEYWEDLGMMTGSRNPRPAERYVYTEWVESDYGEGF